MTPLAPRRARPTAPTLAPHDEEVAASLPAARRNWTTFRRTVTRTTGRTLRSTSPRSMFEDVGLLCCNRPRSRLSPRCLSLQRCEPFLAARSLALSSTRPVFWVYSTIAPRLFLARPSTKRLYADMFAHANGALAATKHTYMHTTTHICRKTTQVPVTINSHRHKPPEYMRLGSTCEGC